MCGVECMVSFDGCMCAMCGVRCADMYCDMVRCVM